MKVEISRTWDTSEPYGIKLIAETPAEDDILLRFWKGGVKLNSRGHEELQFTFKDLIKEVKVNGKTE